MSRTITPLFVFLAIVSAVACDKVPLLAPTESTINLTVSTTTMAANGTAQVIATVIEKGGTPVQNGTVVTFTGSLGSFEPPEASTENGKATSIFRANGTSGTAKIGAVSGGAKATEIEVKIGSAAAETVNLRADPASVPATGGSVDLIAVVTDVSGNALPGTTVVFSADAGQLTASSVITDNAGEARTRLTTNRETAVRARVGTKEATLTVRAIQTPSTTISVAPATPLAGVPVTFTVTPTIPTGGSAIRNVTLDPGDGSPAKQLGAISGATPVQHTYLSAGAYRVTVTVTDVAGLQNFSSTEISVQRPSVVVTINAPSTGQVGAAVTFAVAVSNPNNVNILSVVLSYGDGTSTTFGQTGGSATKTYIATGPFTATATATDQAGNRFSSTHQITIAPAAAFPVTLDAQSADSAIPLSCVPQIGYPKTCNTRMVGAGVRVQFTAGATPPGFSSVFGYEWSFGDGSPVERTTSPSIDHIFRAPSEYRITVRVLTTGGDSSQYLTLIVSPP